MQYNINKSPPSNHEEFVQQRRKIAERMFDHYHLLPLGGSDICKVLNLAYESPYTLVPIHRGKEVRSQAPNPFMLDGLKYERVASFLWNLMYPDDPVTLTTTQFHISGGVPFVVSTDGLLLNSKRIFEVKTLAFETEESFTLANETTPYGIPLKYVGQLELYLDAFNYSSAVMMFLVMSTPGNREIFDQILERPNEMSQFMTVDVIRSLCFTRQYDRPNLNLWFWMVHQVLLFQEIVHDHEIYLGRYFDYKKGRYVDGDIESLRENKPVSLKEREREFKENNALSNTKVSKRLCSIPKGTKREDNQYYWFNSRKVMQQKITELLFERHEKLGYSIECIEAEPYIPPPAKETKDTQRSSLYCSESLLQ